MKDIKYIFCDLDATLLNDDKSLSLENIIAIRSLNEKNIGFVIATGRMPFLITNIIDQLKGNSDVYSICTNGAIILKNKDCILKKYSLENDEVEYIKQIAVDNDLGMFVSSENEIICYNLSTIKETKLEGHVRLVELGLNALNVFLKQTIYKISLINKDVVKLLNVKNEIENRFNLSVAFSTKNTIEIVAKGRSKGIGIKEFCDLNNISLDNTLSIGDNDNDYSMLSTTKYSATVMNGLEHIKDMVDYVSKASNNEAAVSEIIKEFIFKQEDMNNE